MRWMMAIVLLVLGCRLEDKIRGRDRRAELVTPAAAPAPNCTTVGDTGLLRPLFLDFPEDMTEGDMFNAALQFLITAGARIDSQDPIAHTIVTGRVVGETLPSTCSVNTYRSFVFRIAIVGQRMIITADCFGSVGWPWNPGIVTRCAADLVSKADATLPKVIFDGAVDLVNVRRQGAPPAPPPTLFVPAETVRM